MNIKHVGQALGSGGTKEGRTLRVTVEGHVQDKMTVWMCGVGGGALGSKVTSPSVQKCL